MAPLATPLRLDVAKSNEGRRPRVRGVSPSSERCPHGLDMFVPLPAHAAGARRGLFWCAAALGLLAPRRSRRRRRASTATTRLRGSRKPRRLRRPAVGHRSLYELAHNLFVTAGYKPSGTRARGTSTRSTRCPTRAGSRTASARRRSPPTRSRAAPMLGRAARPGQMGDHPRENGRRQPGLHGAGCQRRDVVSRVRPAQQPRGRHRRGRRRHQAVLGAGLQPGRDVPHDVRSASAPRSIRRRPCAGRPASGRRSRATT